MDIFPIYLGKYGSDVVGISGYRAVTGPIKDPQGVNLPSGVLRVKLLSPTVDGSRFIAPVVVERPILHGDVTMQLAAPALYGVQVVDGDDETVWDFQAYLGADTDAPISLAEWYLATHDLDDNLDTIPRTFVGLLDTPNSLLDQAGALVTVNETEDGVGFTSKIIWGNGSPEGVVVADIGAVFLREDGGVGTTLYVKEADNELDTGWAAK